MSDAAQAPGTPLARAAGHVFLVEDEAPVRRSLALLLQLHGYATREFGSAEDFLAARPDERPACALVDVRLPGMSGLALQARMVHDELAPPVLLMTAQGDAALARSALLQGASDFLEKPIEEDELLGAVAAALAADVERAKGRRERDGLLARLAQLSRHERALFEHITNGRQYGEIAEELGLPLAQLESQRIELMRKLQLRRAADLFRLRFRLDELASGRRVPPGPARAAERS